MTQARNAALEEKTQVGRALLLTRHSPIRTAHRSALTVVRTLGSGRKRAAEARRKAPGRSLLYTPYFPPCALPRSTREQGPGPSVVVLLMVGTPSRVGLPRDHHRPIGGWPRGRTWTAGRSSLNQTLVTTRARALWKLGRHLGSMAHVRGHLVCATGCPRGGERDSRW